MNGWLHHLPLIPVLLPLLCGAALLLFAELRDGTRTAIALCAAIAQLAACAALLYMASGGAPEIWPDGIGVYLAGDWRAPFGIVLVVDRLSAFMLMLSAVLALAVLVYSLARRERAETHFHPLFQFLLMGINGAFLTGDLFNLFVFFEVLLAASYGLLLHGAGTTRVKAGLHYIAINLVTSLVFLTGLALIYGASGTLNMADLAARLPVRTGGDRILLEAGVALVSLAFLVKAGIWPLNFWLLPAYTAAAAPVAAIFSIMTKVGIYALLRLGTLLYSAEAPHPLHAGWLYVAGLATLGFASAALLTVQQPQRAAACYVIASSGTLLAAFVPGSDAMIGPGLFYLASSVLATGIFFMLSEMIERSQPFGANVLAITSDSFIDDQPPDPKLPAEVVGIAIPATTAFLGLAFIFCALLVTGLPPLSGFVAKFALLAAALGAAPSWPAWTLPVAILLSGLIGIVALCRMGTRIFWSGKPLTARRLRITEAGPVAALLLVSVLLVAQAGPVAAYLDATGRLLYMPQTYIDAVLSAQPARSSSAQAAP